jgi:PfaB family protein
MREEIAIVGMEAIFGPDEGLDTFERSIYDGIQPFNSFPPSAPPLMQKAIDGALQDTKSKTPGNKWGDIALIVVSEADLSDLQADPRCFFKEDSVFSALQKAQGLLSDQEVNAVIIGAAHLLDAAKSSSFKSLEARPNTGPDAGFDHTTNGMRVGEGAGAVLLKRADKAKQDQDRIYAIIDAVAQEPHNSPSDTLPAIQKGSDICKKAFNIAGVRPSQIAYLEVSGNGIGSEDQVEIKGMVQAYQTEKGGLTCALGCVKANIGHASEVSALAGLIKTALCLYHRYIPATPQWTSPMDIRLWEQSPFYVATGSRTWFLDDVSPKRIAALNSIESNGVSHLIMSEDAAPQFRPNRYLAQAPPCCLPLKGDNQADLKGQLNSLRKKIEASSCLSDSARQNFSAFQDRAAASYALMVVGQNKEELVKEIQFMLRGVPYAFAKGKEWKTPTGSYFTANPLGLTGQVAFVYPGVGSPYVGLGQDIFHLFPEIYNHFSELTSDIGELLKEKKLYPRSRERLTDDQIKGLERRLRGDIMAISECGMGFSVLYTMILKGAFKVTPHCALGYSLGEAAMMASLGVWIDPGQLTDRFRKSPTFRECLHGRLSAVRQYWRLDESSAAANKRIWESYTLLAPPQTVRDAINGEELVYLTLINTAEDVVISGDPESCLRVIEKLGCEYFPLRLDLAIHCEPTRLEYDRLVDLYMLPISNKSGIRFYSSSYYKPIPIRTKAVAHSIARAFCGPVDFPRLVNRVYEDGAGIFIEMGSRQACSAWIDEILKDKNHVAIPINVKGIKDQASIVRALAQLVSHRVSVDLSPLF